MLVRGELELGDRGVAVISLVTDGANPFILLQ